MSPNDRKILSMDADVAHEECSCIISSPSPGKAEYGSILVSYYSFPSIRNYSKKGGRDRFLPKDWKKWKNPISSRTEGTIFFHGKTLPSEDTANPDHI